MKARDLLRAVEEYAKRGFKTPEQALRDLSFEQLQTALWTAADLFKKIKAEVDRRGLWDECVRAKNERDLR